MLFRSAMAKMEEDNKKAGLRLERTGAILKTITKVIDVDVVLSKEFPNVTEQFGDTISQIDAAIADNNSYLQNNLGWQRQLVHIRNHLNVALAENAYWQSQIILWMVDSNTGDIIPNPEAEVELAKLVAYENQMTDSLCDINTQLGGTIDPVTGKPTLLGYEQNIRASLQELQAKRAAVQSAIDRIKDRRGFLAGVGMDYQITIKIRPLSFWGDAGKAWNEVKDKDAAIREAEYACALKMAKDYLSRKILNDNIASELAMQKMITDFKKKLEDKAKVASELDSGLRYRIKEYDDMIEESKGLVKKYNKELRELDAAGITSLSGLAKRGVIQLTFVDKDGKTQSLETVDPSKLPTELYANILEKAGNQWPEVRRALIARNIDEINVSQLSRFNNLWQNLQIELPGGSREEWFTRAVIGVYVTIIEPGKTYRIASDKIGLLISEDRVKAVSRNFEARVLTLQKEVENYTKKMIHAKAARDKAAAALEKAQKDWRENFDPNESVILAHIRFEMRQAQRQYNDGLAKRNRAIMELQLYLHAAGKGTIEPLEKAAVPFTQEEIDKIATPVNGPLTASKKAPNVSWETKLPDLQRHIASIRTKTTAFLNAALGKGNYTKGDVDYWAGYFVYLSSPLIRGYADHKAVESHIDLMTKKANEFAPKLKGVTIPGYFTRFINHYKAGAMPKQAPLVGLLDFAAAYEEYTISRGFDAMGTATAPKEAAKRASVKMAEIIDVLKSGTDRIGYEEGLKAAIDEVGFNINQDITNLRYAMMRPYAELWRGKDSRVSTELYKFKDRRLLSALYTYAALNRLTPKEVSFYYSDVLPKLKTFVAGATPGEEELKYVKELRAAMDAETDAEKKELIAGWIRAYEDMAGEQAQLNLALTLLGTVIERSKGDQAKIAQEIKLINIVAQDIKRIKGLPKNIDIGKSILGTFKNITSRNITSQAIEEGRYDILIYDRDWNNIESYKPATLPSIDEMNKELDKLKNLFGNVTRTQLTAAREGKALATAAKGAPAGNWLNA